MKLKEKYVVLEKIDGSYRVDLPVGNKEIQGLALEEPKIGESFKLYSATWVLQAWTSAVKEIDHKNKIIKTANSTYKYEIKE